MRHRLSTGPHPLVVYLFATIWILGFGTGTYQMLFHREELVFNGVRGAATLSDQLFSLLSLHLDRSTPLGDCITFIPVAARVADEIEALAGKARAGTSQITAHG